MSAYWDLVNLNVCIKMQAERVGIEHDDVAAEGVVVRMAAKIEQLQGEHDKAHVSQLIEADPRVKAWHTIAEHPLFASCYDEDRPLLDSVVAKLDTLAKPQLHHRQRRAATPRQVSVPCSVGAHMNCGGSMKLSELGEGPCLCSCHTGSTHWGTCSARTGGVCDCGYPAEPTSREGRDW